MSERLIAHLKTSNQDGPTYTALALKSAIMHEDRTARISIETERIATGAPYNPFDVPILVALDTATLSQALRTDKSVTPYQCWLTTPETCTFNHDHSAIVTGLQLMTEANALQCFDLSVWGRLRIELSLDPILSLAPAWLTNGQNRDRNRVIVFLNTKEPTGALLDDVMALARMVLPQADFLLLDHTNPEPQHEAAWLSPSIRNATCHIHIGEPSSYRAHGRLVDSSACQAPIILFESETSNYGRLPEAVQPSPKFENDVHLLRVSQMRHFQSGFRDLIGDVALRAQLAANATTLCRSFNRMVATSLINSLHNTRLGAFP